jgi:hypothetical protein
LSSLPVAVCGRSATNATSSGSHHRATLSRRKPEQLIARQLLPRLFHDYEQRALLPLRVGDADHRRLGDRRVPHRGVLQRDRRDPLAARLDHVLRAVGDVHVAVGVDRRDVPCVEETVGIEDRFVLFAEIRARGPRTAHEQMPECDAVVRELVAVGIDDLHLDPVDAAPLLLLQVEPPLQVAIPVLRQQVADGSERRHLGHSPAVQDERAELQSRSARSSLEARPSRRSPTA